MTDELKALIQKAKSVRVSPQELEEQRQSFAFGNTNIENPRITREMVREEAKALNEGDGENA